MQILLNPFPAVYINLQCKKHQCSVEIHIEPSKKFDTTEVIGAQITTLKCKEGGPVQFTDCMDSWEMSILGGGDVTITQ